MRTLLPFLAVATLGAAPLVAQRPPACAPDNAGLKLPAGFCALLVGEDLGNVRHIAVAPNGDVFAAVAGPKGGLWLFRDTTGDGRADLLRRIVETAGTGVALAPDAVYFAPNDRVLRFPWKPGALEPSGPADTVVSGLPTGGHTAKAIVLGPGGSLFVTFGSRTNSCQVADRQNNSPGNAPCTELEQRAGIWRFDARKKGQTVADGRRYATGLRNPMAMAIQPGTGALFSATHGRDQLHENWGFSEEDGRENPAEEFGPIPEGADYGWPYCYFDPRKGQKVQAPEYGGDGTKVGDCAKYARPAVAFPAHWAPESSVFYTGTQFPAAWRSGVFIAFHGSWNRGNSPEMQQGYRVAFMPFANGKATGTYETFMVPAAAHNAIRPMGLAVGPDGSLYIGSDAQARLWRVFYRP